MTKPIASSRRWRSAALIGLVLATVTAAPAAAVVLTPPPGARDLHFEFENGACIGLTATITFKCNKTKKPPQVEAAWPDQLDTITISAGLLPSDGDVFDGALAANKWRFVTLAAWTDGNGNYLPDPVIRFGDYGGIVPEPATWSLLILGFGAVGTALRRRTRLSPG